MLTGALPGRGRLSRRTHGSAKVEGMQTLRTPDDRFDGLPGFGFAPHYAEISAADAEMGALRVHYLDEGPPAGPVVVLLHGEPSWCYLYRHMVPVLVDAGLRVVAPDLVGFGRSDKPTQVGEHTYAAHVTWMRELLFGALDLRDVTLVGQDWGGLIGLRLVAEHPDRFARVVAANTGLPTGEQQMPDIWLQFRDVVATVSPLDVGRLVASGCAQGLPPEVVAGYDAPFPDETYKAGPKAMPMLVPTAPEDPGGIANRAAWESLAGFDKPFLTAFSDLDPITAGGDRPMRSRIPGAAGQPHTVIEGGGHFLQEDRGPELARVVADFVRST